MDSFLPVATRFNGNISVDMSVETKEYPLYGD